MLSDNPPLDTLTARARQLLEETFDKQATVFAVAPGRVNLIGEHIDYCDGFVLPFAIERAIVIAAAPNDTQTANIVTESSDERATLDLSVDQEISDPSWSNYIRGVVQGFRRADLEIPGFDAAIVSSVPSGGGLSSSAALECAAARLLENLTGTTIETRALALLAQKAEHEFANVPCGIMDQFASAFGEEDSLVLIDCLSGEPTLVPFNNPDLTVLIANTKVSHSLADGGYAARRKSTEDGLAAIGLDSWRKVKRADLDAAEDKMDPVTFKRSRHVVGEIERTVEAAEALAKNDFEKLGPLMSASHTSLRNDFEVSCEELDILVAIANDIGREGGVIGARMTGGGFGGSTVTLCEARFAASIAKRMAKEYEEKTGIEPEIFASRPAQGARVL